MAYELKVLSVGEAKGQALVSLNGKMLSVPIPVSSDGTPVPQDAVLDAFLQPFLERLLKDQRQKQALNLQGLVNQSFDVTKKVEDALAAAVVSLDTSRPGA